MGVGGCSPIVQIQVFTELKVVSEILMLFCQLCP